MTAALVRTVTSLIAGLVLTGSGLASAQDAAPAQEELLARLELSETARALEAAERDLEGAELRYSAARSGQAHKHDNPILSLMNPGSRERWRRMVAEAEAEIAGAQEELASAQGRHATMVQRWCGRYPALPDCSR